MKFKIVLWMMGFMMERASKTNPKVQQKLAGQNITIEIGSQSGYARHFIIENQRIYSYPGKATAPVFMSKAHEPNLAITFASDGLAFKTFTAKDKQFAMMTGLQNKQIKVEGNPLFLAWFESLMKLVQK